MSMKKSTSRFFDMNRRRILLGLFVMVLIMVLVMISHANQMPNRLPIQAQTQSYMAPSQTAEGEPNPYDKYWDYHLGDIDSGGLWGSSMIWIHNREKDMTFYSPYGQGRSNWKYTINGVERMFFAPFGENPIIGETPSHPYRNGQLTQRIEELEVTIKLEPISPTRIKISSTVTNPTLVAKEVGMKMNMDIAIGMNIPPDVPATDVSVPDPIPTGAPERNSHEPSQYLPFNMGMLCKWPEKNLLVQFLTNPVFEGATEAEFIAIGDMIDPSTQLGPHNSGMAYAHTVDDDPSYEDAPAGINTSGFIFFKTKTLAPSESRTESFVISMSELNVQPVITEFNKNTTLTSPEFVTPSSEVLFDGKWGDLDSDSVQIFYRIDGGQALPIDETKPGYPYPNPVQGEGNAFSGKITLPADLSSGDHTIQIFVVDDKGALSSNQTIYIHYPSYTITQHYTQVDGVTPIEGQSTDSVQTLYKSDYTYSPKTIPKWIATGYRVEQGTTTQPPPVGDSVPAIFSSVTAAHTISYVYESDANENGIIDSNEQVIREKYTDRTSVVTEQFLDKSNADAVLLPPVTKFIQFGDPYVSTAPIIKEKIYTGYQLGTSAFVPAPAMPNFLSEGKATESVVFFYKTSATVTMKHQDLTGNPIEIGGIPVGDMASFTAVGDPWTYVAPVITDYAYVGYKYVGERTEHAYHAGDPNIDMIASGKPSVILVYRPDPDITATNRVFEITDNVTDTMLLAGVSAIDTADGHLTPTIANKGGLVSGIPGVYDVTYVATDSADHIVEMTVKVFIKDTVTAGDDPYITAPNRVFEKSDTVTDAELLAEVTGFDKKDGTLTPVIADKDGFVSGVPGVYTVTYSASNSANKSAYRTVTILVKDVATTETGLTITAANKIFEKTDDVTDAKLLEGVTAFDTQDGARAPVIADKGHLVSGVSGLYSVRYSATNSRNISAEITVKVLIKEATTIGTDPTITASNKVLELSDTITDAMLLEDVTAFDVKDGVLTPIIENKGGLISGMPGIYDVTYSATDSDMNKVETTIKVMVKAPTTTGVDPFITATNKAFAITDDVTDAKLLKDVTAFDVKEGNLTPTIEDRGGLISGTPGVYDVTYSATDSEGVTVSVTVKVLIKRAKTSGIDPTISALNKVYEVADNVTDANLLESVTAFDIKDGVLIPIISDKGGLLTGIPGIYNVRYSATDSDNNTVETTVQVVIKSSTTTRTGPSITAPNKVFEQSDEVADEKLEVTDEKLGVIKEPQDIIITERYLDLAGRQIKEETSKIVKEFSQYHGSASKIMKHVYQFYKIDNGDEQSGEPVIDSVTSPQTITFSYDQDDNENGQPDVTITEQYVTTRPSVITPETYRTIDKGNSYHKVAPIIAGYDYVGHAINGGELQSSEQIMIENITEDVLATLMYASKKEKTNRTVNPLIPGTTVISGSGEPGTNVTISIPDGTEITVTIGPDGIWTIILPQALAPKDVIQVDFTDSDGNIISSINMIVLSEPDIIPKTNENIVLFGILISLFLGYLLWLTIENLKKG